MLHGPTKRNQVQPQQASIWQPLRHKSHRNAPSTRALFSDVIESGADKVSLYCLGFGTEFANTFYGILGIGR